MSRKKANKIIGRLVVLAGISFVFILGSIGAIEMGGSPVWGVIKSLIGLAVFGFFSRCCVAAIWGV